MPKLLNEKKLISLAVNGDEQAFAQLVSHHKPQVYRVVKRIVGHPEDTEDIIQEGLVKAWTALGTFKQKSRFSTWLISIATRTALDVLRKQKRWRSGAQVAYANLCSQSEVLTGEVIAQFSSPDFSFEVREHISYCFSCVGRSLPPDEWAALLLRDIVSLSAHEASKVLGISDSVLRHRLSAARRSMQDQYDGLCALVSKKGICHQCKGLQRIAPDEKRGGPFPDIKDFADRCAVVRGCQSLSMQNLHHVFWRRTKEIEEQGLGSTEPNSRCGESEDNQGV